MDTFVSALDIFPLTCLLSCFENGLKVANFGQKIWGPLLRFVCRLMPTLAFSLGRGQLETLQKKINQQMTFSVSMIIVCF